MTAKLRRRLFFLSLGLVALFVPVPSPSIEAHGGTPFTWDMAARFSELESRFDAQRTQGCSGFDGSALLHPVRVRLESLTHHPTDAPRPTIPPTDARFDALELAFFDAAARFAACPAHATDLVSFYGEMRTDLKELSLAWAPTDRQGRERLYRLLYGGRLAIEEVLLQMPRNDMPVLVRGYDEPSEAPATEIHGVRVHSGDLLLSRGGAPTSAMIARGNDFPGNFSHVALVHVDDDGTFRTIESHIEQGVVVDGLARYEDDAKLRVLLLRPRASLAPGEAFAHRAASYARERAEAGHIPYDFTSDLADNSRMFCSEVASDAYATEDIHLWQGLTTMSGEGVARWLSHFGVRHFETHGPSDLEYDAQLVVVAEWRAPDTLFEDHVDNAAMDALLTSADRGENLPFAWWKLPFARAVKVYSIIKNWFGAIGPIPEGMSPEAALRVEGLRAVHRQVRWGVLQRASNYRREHRHRAPYWALVRFAEEALAEVSE